jgi:hypothetical protein
MREHGVLANSEMFLSLRQLAAAGFWSNAE